MMINKIKYFLILIFSLFFLKCENLNKKNPNRLSGIPSDAQWYGGKEGGVWIKINKSNKINYYNISIYNDYNGKLLQKGLFRKERNCIKENISYSEIDNFIDAYDGNNIILHDNISNKYCLLIPCN